MQRILSKIKSYCQRRGLTERQLSIRSGVPQRTISSWYRKDTVPTLASLEKICDALDIPLAELFSQEDSLTYLSESQAKLLARWATLTQEQRALLLSMMDQP